MSEFKPMVKMTTDEHSVILKLKKGGKVAKKSDDGFKPMKKAMGGPSLMAAMAGSEPMVGRRMPPAAAPAPKKPSMSARKRAMMAEKMMASPMKSGGKAKHEDAAEDRAMIKKAMAGKKFANGGSVTGKMTKTTVPDSVAKKYDETMMHGTPKGKTSGTTGDVKMGAAGYKDGGTITGNAKKFVDTEMHTAKKDAASRSTGGVKNGNGGGYATGGVALANAGGYKKGGATKKAYATGGTVDTGKPVALKQGNVHSGPKTNINFSGVYKEGGKVTGNTIPNKRLAAINDAENASQMKNAKTESILKYPKTTAGKQVTPKFC